MINKNSELLDACCPMLVASDDNESDEKFEERWRKFDSLSENAKEILSSIETSNIISGILNKYRLSIRDAREISRIIRSYFFNEVAIGLISKKLADNISGLGYPASEDIARIIKDKIISSTSDKFSYESRVKAENISISEALQNYKNLGEQLITSGMIKIKIFPQPVRPSVKNWIEDYRFAMGAQKHGMMERGNYLFHSENTKKLTSGERKKLAEVLRSLDEETTLSINPDKQEIIFEHQNESAFLNQTDKVSPPIRPVPAKPQRSETISVARPNFRQGVDNKISDQKHQISDFTRPAFAQNQNIFRGVTEKNVKVDKSNVPNPKPIIEPRPSFHPDAIPSLCSGLRQLTGKKR